MQPIPDSELILNADGSIYHLNLHPDEIADTILTVGDPNRVAQVSKYFDRIEVRRAHREFVTHTGWLGSQRLTVISTGIGTDNMDIVLNELDALANINFETRTLNVEPKTLNIIRIGTSGSISTEIAIGSFVTSNYAIGLDNLLHFYEHKNNLAELSLCQQFKHILPDNFPAVPYAFAANETLLRKIQLDFHGITLTAPGFYAPQARQLRGSIKLSLETLTLFNNFRYEKLHLTNLEMETAGLYGLASVLGHRALSCNGILTNRMSGEFSKNPAEIVEKLIQSVLEQVSESGFSKF